MNTYKRRENIAQNLLAKLHNTIRKRKRKKQTSRVGRELFKKIVERNRNDIYNQQRIEVCHRMGIDPGTAFYLDNKKNSVRNNAIKSLFGSVRLLPTTDGEKKKDVQFNTNPNVSQNNLNDFEKKLENVGKKVAEEIEKIGNVLVNNQTTSNMRIITNKNSSADMPDPTSDDDYNVDQNSPKRNIYDPKQKNRSKSVDGSKKKTVIPSIIPYNLRYNLRSRKGK